MPTIKVNGFDLYYQAGGEGEPVVFVHGGFASLDTKLRAILPNDWMWEWEFAHHFHFITYDRRGCWRSSSPDGGYELTNQAEDLECLLDDLGLQSIHLIGSSAGGPISVLFAATRPDRVRSLVLVGTGPNLFPAGNPPSDTIRRQIQLLEREGPEAAFEQRPAGVEVSLEVLWELEEEKARGSLSEYLTRQQALVAKAGQLSRADRIRYYAIELKNMKAYMDIDIRPYARRVAAPTLVIQGSNDKVVPLEWAQDLAGEIPSARFFMIEGGSHGLLFRNPEARQAAIQFIKLLILPNSCYLSH
jgi:pimeloyl-ACP methyl ester carboxylesterase